MECKAAKGKKESKQPTQKPNHMVAKGKKKSEEPTQKPNQMECKAAKGKKESKQHTQKPNQTVCKVANGKNEKKGSEVPTQKPNQMKCKAAKGKKENKQPTQKPNHMVCKVLIKRQCFTRVNYNLVAKENKKSEKPTQKPNQMECKYCFRTEGCEYGKDCGYIHGKTNVYEAQAPELNFLGLPIRPGEKECPFYMENGSCKFGDDCKFNHPDPMAFEADDQTPVYVNGVLGGSIPSSPANVASWSVQSPLNEPAPYVLVVDSPAQGLSCPSPEWNGYQTPFYAQEGSMRPPAAFLMNNTTAGTSIYAHQELPLSGDEFLERPGEPECSYFVETGDCKFNYSSYGICKFGPACKFDHLVQLPSSSLSAPENNPWTAESGNSSSVQQ